MDTQEQQQWVDDTLNSIDRIARAQAPSFTLADIQKRKSVHPLPINKRYIWIAAACISLLVLLNIYTCFNIDQGTTPGNTSHEAVMQYFQAVPDIQI